MSEEIEDFEDDSSAPDESIPLNINRKAWAKPKQDVANKDAFVGAGGYSLPQKVNVTYTAVFDSEEQLKQFQHFLRLLKKEYPEVRTIGGRIAEYLMGKAVPELEKVHGKAKKKSGKDFPVGHAPYEDVRIEKENA